jgi:2-dehydropantoate 2-reductase
MDELKGRFGAEKVLGGLCFIETTLDEEGHIAQYSANHDLVFGEWDEKRTARVEAIENLFAGANMIARLSGKIRLEMWQKYIFISAMSGMTCLMQSPIGPILSSPYGKATYERLLQEIVAIAQTVEPRIPPDIPAQILARMESLEPTMKSTAHCRSIRINRGTTSNPNKKSHQQMVAQP